MRAGDGRRRARAESPDTVSVRHPSEGFALAFPFAEDRRGDLKRRTVSLCHSVSSHLCALASLRPCVESLLPNLQRPPPHGRDRGAAQRRQLGRLHGDRELLHPVPE
jgi:hypothetical protein